MKALDEEMVRSSDRLLKILGDLHFAYERAFWAHNAHDDTWHIFLIADWLDTEGTASLIYWLSRVYRKLELSPTLILFYLHLCSPKELDTLAIRSHLARSQVDDEILQTGELIIAFGLNIDCVIDIIANVEYNSDMSPERFYRSVRLLLESTMQ